MADEPRRLKSLKEILSIFKPEGFDRLMLKLKKGKQLGEQKLATNDLNRMMLLESYFKNMDEGFVDYTDEDMERVFSKIDSLDTEISKTDSLINILEQEKNVEVDSSKIIETFTEGLGGGGVAGLTKKAIQKGLTQKIGGKMAQWKNKFSPETLRLFNADQTFFWNSVRKFERGIDESDPNYILSKKAFEFYRDFLK